NTGGTDAFNLHSYNIGVGIQFDDGDVNVGGSYAYNALRLPVRIAAGRTVLERGGYRVDGVQKSFREENWRFNLASNIPFESRPGSRWSLSFDYDFDYFRTIEAPDVMLDPTQRVPVVPISDYIQTGVGTRLSFSNVRGTAFGV